MSWTVVGDGHTRNDISGNDARKLESSRPMRQTRLLHADGRSQPPRARFGSPVWRTKVAV